MRFQFVTGVKIKTFYLNYFPTKKIDLLIFNWANIDGVCWEEVNQDLIDLNSILKCPIVVLYGGKTPCFIVCSNKKMRTVGINNDTYLYINNKLILLTCKNFISSKACAIITFNCNSSKIGKYYPNYYFACERKGVCCCKYRKISKKFRKCSYFILRFKKNVL